MNTDSEAARSVVVSREPDARASYCNNGWQVERGWTGVKLSGYHETEAEAWVEAADYWIDSPEHE